MNRLNYSCKKFYSTGAFVNVIKTFFFIFIRAALFLVRVEALCTTPSFRLLTLAVNIRLECMDLITAVKSYIVQVSFVNVIKLFSSGCFSFGMS